MKRVLLFVALIATSLNCIAAKPAKKAENLTRAQRIYAELHNPDSKYVLVAAHRADWRNFPENSLEAIESAIQMGVDIIELDIKKTKDGHIILMHDTVPASVDAALRIVDTLQSQGYTFVTVEELLQLSGVTPEPGVMYRSATVHTP